MECGALRRKGDILLFWRTTARPKRGLQVQRGGGGGGPRVGSKRRSSVDALAVVATYVCGQQPLHPAAQVPVAVQPDQ
jgi:hypothetical protein